MSRQECCTTDYIRERILEFLGGHTAERNTCVNLSNSRGVKDTHCVVKPAKYIDYFIELEKDFSRSLLDRESLLIDLDIEYANFDFPAEPYLDRKRAFSLQQPAFSAIRAILEEYGIFPLCLMTGRGYHFIWRVRKTGRAFTRLARLGHLTKEMKKRYLTLKYPISLQVGRAFSGSGMVVEYLMHQVCQRLSGQTEIPVQVLEVTVAPQQRGREIIALDISEYADPLNTRYVRVPFSIYLKPFWKPGILTPEIRDQIPLIMVAPLCSDDLEYMVAATQNLKEMECCAQEVSTAIPEMSSGTERLTQAYENSQLHQFHQYFYEASHEPVERWPLTYDRMRLDYLPPCVRYILEHPNDLLLSPAAIRLLTAILMATQWHPRHIAGLIRSKYERDYGWLNEWYVYDAGTRADFYTRVFAGLIELKQDKLDDLNCESLQKAGLCLRPDAACRTQFFTKYLFQKEISV